LHCIYTSADPMDCRFSTLSDMSMCGRFWRSLCTQNDMSPNQSVVTVCMLRFHELRSVSFQCSELLPCYRVNIAQVLSLSEVWTFGAVARFSRIWSSTSGIGSWKVVILNQPGMESAWTSDVFYRICVEGRSITSNIKQHSLRL